MRLFNSGSRSFLIAVVIHGITFLALSVYLIVQHPNVQEILETTFLESIGLVKLKHHSPLLKTAPKPIVSTEQLVVTKVPLTPRITTSATIKITNIQAETVVEFSKKYMAFDAKINPNVPKVNSSQPVIQVVTHADRPISNAPIAVDFATPVASGIDEETSINRGMVGGATQIAQPMGLAMVANVGAKLDALGKVVQQMTLGEVEVTPLPKGEPGGRVIGRDKEIQGVFRFSRVRHNLSDWWADASSLNALVKWLNEQTKINTDMNVEGGALKLTGANVMKCPLLFMTGHDPALVRSRNLLSNMGGKIDNRLSEAENAALRKYLIEKGGFLIFDDCGVNAPAQAMIRIFLGILRQAMPE
jgi:hypothetical protein